MNIVRTAFKTAESSPLCGTAKDATIINEFITTIAGKAAILANPVYGKNSTKATSMRIVGVIKSK